MLGNEVQAIVNPMRAFLKIADSMLGTVKASNIVLDEESYRSRH